MDETLSGKTILLVEDDTFLLDIFAARFQKAGAAVKSVLNGNSVLGVARDTHPDLIILDILLPEMDGVHILRLLREDPATAHIPVIIFSNVEDPEKLEECKKLGVQDFFKKATEPDEMVERASAILKAGSTAHAQ